MTVMSRTSSILLILPDSFDKQSCPSSPDTNNPPRLCGSYRSEPDQAAAQSVSSSCALMRLIEGCIPTCFLVFNCYCGERTFGLGAAIRIYPFLEKYRPHMIGTEIPNCHDVVDYACARVVLRVRVIISSGSSTSAHCLSTYCNNTRTGYLSCCSSLYILFEWV